MQSTKRTLKRIVSKNAASSNRGHSFLKTLTTLLIWYYFVTLGEAHCVILSTIAMKTTVGKAEASGEIGALMSLPKTVARVSKTHN